ncbi:unnamed protein product [Rangifer tarandus platyrhynchus]|uniref:Uncharacterized protein n=2 Tax=Rangifer tarandus platyrhynchus TaxID=3082113 RepID=A0ABN8ZNL6_RANTA|nr:unnamed protein product [Rangifer tarandus platyrhynchus]
MHHGLMSTAGPRHGGLAGSPVPLPPDGATQPPGVLMGLGKPALPGEAPQDKRLPSPPPLPGWSSWPLGGGGRTGGQLASQGFTAQQAQEGPGELPLCRLRGWRCPCIHPQPWGGPGAPSSCPERLLQTCLRHLWPQLRPAVGAQDQASPGVPGSAAAQPRASGGEC